MTTTRFFQQVFQSIFACLLISTLLTGCGSGFPNSANLSTRMAELREPMQPTAALSPTSERFDLQLPGTLIFSCVREISVYGFQQKTIKTLATDNHIIFNNIGWKRDRIYYLRTTERKSQGTPYAPITPPATPPPLPATFGPEEVFQMKLDGTDAGQLTFDDYSKLYMAVSPKGSFILYSSDWEGERSTTRYKLVLLNVDNKTEKIILEGDSQFLPVWSPEEDKVAILQTPPNPGEKANLYLFDFGQNQIIQLVSEDYVVFTTIAWSPDQKYLVIGVKRQNDYTIDFLNVSTGKIDQVIPIEDEPGNFAWSPDGSKILLETRNRSNNIDASIKLWMLNFPDKDLKLVYAGGIDGRIFSYHAVWSPESQAFAFFRSKDESGMRLVVQSSVLSKKEFSPEVSCSSQVRSAVWIAIH